jgi:hypothetical protein
MYRLQLFKVDFILGVHAFEGRYGEDHPGQSGKKAET